MRDLDDVQIDALFMYHVMRPTDDQLRRLYAQESQARVAQDTLPEEILRARGWSQEQINALRRDIPLVGMAGADGNVPAVLGGGRGR